MKKLALLSALVLLLLCLAGCGQEQAAGQDQTTGQDKPQGMDPAPFRTVGNIVTFGHYEQDNDPDNGPEPIEWIVLDVQDGKALLLSRYGLEAKPYNTELENITWENCSLRSWLNDEFLTTAFSDAEQSAILLTDVDNSDSQGYSEWNTSGGNNTQDRVFLLSYAEANKYLDVTYENSENTKSRVSPTEYAIKTGADADDRDKTADGKPAGFWWLRSPGHEQYVAAYVHKYGSLCECGVHSDNGAVRPAFWIDLNADIF